LSLSLQVRSLSLSLSLRPSPWKVLVLWICNQILFACHAVTIDHSILIRWLSTWFCLDGTVLSWFSSYLYSPIPHLISVSFSTITLFDQISSPFEIFLQQHIIFIISVLSSTIQPLELLPSYSPSPQPANSTRSSSHLTVHISWLYLMCLPLIYPITPSAMLHLASGTNFHLTFILLLFVFHLILYMRVITHIALTLVRCFLSQT
jgi:hypothetical protein